MKMDEILDLAKKVYFLETLQRFNDIPRVKNESVAEHCYLVVLFTRMLYQVFMQKLSLNLQKMIDMAIIHDLAEVNLGDTSHRVKKLNPDLEATLNKIEVAELKNLLKDDYFVDCLREFNSQETFESKIVKLADILSVIVYAQNTLNLGNMNMLNILKGAVKRANQLLEELHETYRFDFIDCTVPLEVE